MSVATVTIQIGNSDNKLSQERWSQYINALSQLLLQGNAKIHFFGFSAPTAPWQNCCAVIDEPENPAWLEEDLAALARSFERDSIALTAGTTQFVEASHV
jgi:hypothetical protein